MRRSPVKKMKIEMPSGGMDTTLISSLALFIMLLSFFIVLVANSSFEEHKALPVLESLNRTFTMRAFRDGAGPSLAPDMEQGTGAGQSSLEIAGEMFRAEFPGIEVRQIPSRGFLYVQMSEAALSSAQSSVKKKALEKLIRMAVLGEENSKTPKMQLEIWLNIQGDIPKASSGASSPLARAAALGRRMEEMGLPQGYVTTGIAPGKSGTVSLFFRPYKPYTPVP